MTQGHTAEGLSVKRQIIANKITLNTMFKKDGGSARRAV